MIRKFEPRDLNPVSALWLDGNIEAHDFIPRAYWQAHAPLVRQQFLQAELYVYEAAGDILGFAGLQADYIAGIFVAAHSRSAGIGRALLDAVKDTRPALSLHVYRKNRDAVRFYRREGFCVLAERTDKNTGESEYLMAWRRDGKSPP